MILGIILGILLGLLTGMVPGLNLGIFFLLAYKQGLPNNFLLFLFLTSAIINGVVSNITLLTPVAQAGDPLYLAPMQKLIAAGKGYQVMTHAFFYHASGLGFVLLIGLFFIFTDKIYLLKSALLYIPLSAGVALLLWGTWLSKRDRLFSYQ